ncbi:MAG: [acyl-carrier-protein] S-malonyltransferase [Bacteroidetes bacterium 46-16]|nr:MAG: [acyl-carrier-protein] S-malonyltransferase [Bacteroidetes bacterium 46-16]
MKHAYIFPGQGAQFSGMGKNLYEQSSLAKEYFEQANEILGFRITDIMFGGSDEDLKQTKVTQPAVFLHSVILFNTTPGLIPDVVAGHSLGELSALVANKVLSFEDGLRLVSKRAQAMQKACEINPSTMAAVLGMKDAKIEEILSGISDEVVVPANYNSPGQLVISGSIAGINKACELLKAAGAKRALVLPVGGAFHSPLMEPAKEELAAAIEATHFSNPTCPVYQNVDANPYIDPHMIRQNLINQLTSPVRWTQSVEHMVRNGVTQFTEVGPGTVLQGLVKKIAKDVVVDGIN